MDLALIYGCVQDLRSSPNGRKVQNDIFFYTIYEFNIYLFFKVGEAVIGELH